MKNHLWFALFFLLSSIIANGQMYTYHDAWFDANGNVVAENSTQATGGYGKTAYAYAHIQMPSGAVNSNSSTGSPYAQAVTQKSPYGESGQFIFSGYNEVNDVCWDTNTYSDFQEPMPICAIPVAFQQQSVQDLKNCGLHFEYRWAASTGDPNDLGSCTVGQYVGYPTSGGYYSWPSPPFSGGNTNPIVTDFAATIGGFADENTSGPFVKPYQEATFTATQFFRFKCGCYNQGNYVNVAGPIQIVRSVNKNADGTYRCTITKSGSSSVLNPLP